MFLKEVVIKSAVIYFKGRNLCVCRHVVIKSCDISEKLNFLIKLYSQSKNHSQLSFKVNFLKKCKYAGELRADDKHTILFTI